MTTFINASEAPTVPSRRVSEFTSPLFQTADHSFCAGCGEPVTMRLILEVIESMKIEAETIAVIGHGCYGGFVTTIDVDVLQCLHGRAPSCATGIKRMRPECSVFTLTGDGDMVNEGLQEVLHTAARSESVTSILLNNGVFGDTGGHMTAATVVGQRTKNTLNGRDPNYHGYPIPIANLLAQLDGVAYVARGAVDSPGNIAHTRRMIRRAFELQRSDAGFTFVEVLTMCPTGWFVPAKDGPGYMNSSLGQKYPLGVLRDTTDVEGD